MNATVIVLAAGLGTRMKSRLAKALHTLAGRPLIQHVLDAASSIEPEKIALVLGHQADAVRKAVEKYRTEVVIQSEQLGTGHAVLQAKEAIAGATGPVLILCADTPLITAGTLRSLLDLHTKTGAAVTLLTTMMQDPFGYGRVIRGRSGVMRVVEEKDAVKAQKMIREVNAGIYCFDPKFLLSSLGMIGKSNAQGEYYLTDTIGLARKSRRKVAALLCRDTYEVMGINSRHELSLAEKIVQSRTNRRWMTEGVTMLEPGSVFIGHDVVLSKDVLLYPNVMIEGKTSIGDGTVVHSGARIVNSRIGRDVCIKDCSVIEDSDISDCAAVGPFAHLRPGTVLKEKAKIGNFVEVKKSVIGEGSKANHLAYIGDAVVGRDVNIGAGVITCNYDGFEKHQTVIEDGVFVGSDAQLVAPVKIGKGALVAAGATITRNVPPDALAISRASQEIREGFVSRRNRLRRKK